MAKYYCTECGNELNNDSKFCPKCGHPTTSNDNLKQNIKTKNDVDDLYGMLLMVYDGEDFGYRYSKSKILGLIVFLCFFIFGLFSFASIAFTEVRFFILILFVSLIPYIIIICIGFAYRKLTEHYWG